MNARENDFPKSGSDKLLRFPPHTDESAGAQGTSGIGNDAEGAEILTTFLDFQKGPCSLGCGKKRNVFKGIRRHDVPHVPQDIRPHGRFFH